MGSVTRKTSVDRGRRREEVETKLLAAIERMLARDESFTEISVERLVREADIARSTFYVYFNDKGHLLEKLTQDVIADFLRAASGWWDLPPGASREEVRAGIQAIADSYRPHGLLIGAVVDAASYDGDVRNAYETMLNRAIDEVARHIREGQEAGSIRPELDPQATAGWLTWMAERGLLQMVRDAEGEWLETLLDSWAAVYWNTLYAKAD